jgi:hypothetical protein
LVSSLRPEPFLSLTSLFQEGERDQERKKGERERERERDFYYSKIGGEGTFADVYKEEKGKDESIRRLVGFPNGLDGDWSKAQKDLMTL